MQRWPLGLVWGRTQAMAKHGNWLLKCLEPAVRAQFKPRMRQVELERGEVLQHPGAEVRKVYFPEGALIGLISAMAGGDAVQTATVGWDGALGVFEACGTRQSAFRAEVQVEGPAWMMSAEDYRRMYAASDDLRTAVHKYVEILLTEARQFVACNALHSVSARLCRSVLEALERSRDGHSLPVTQEALAQMLGVQRTTITAAISQLQAAGALRSTRGVIRVIEPQVLEDGACCCRDTLRMARAEIYASDQTVCDD